MSKCSISYERNTKAEEELYKLRKKNASLESRLEYTSRLLKDSQKALQWWNNGDINKLLSDCQNRVAELEAQQSKSIFKQSAIMYFSPILVVYNFIIRLITSDKKGK